MTRSRSSSTSGSEKTAIVGGTVLTASRGGVEKGTVLIERGRIARVGKGLKVPRGHSVVDAGGRFVTPGRIDAHTHVGVFVEGVGAPGADGNDATDPVTPHLRVIDGVNPEDQAFADARENGVTTVCIAPGSANVIGGRTSVFKTVGTVADTMLVSDRSGLKVAFGENPKRIYGSRGKMPSTRMGVAALIREMLVDAREYAAKRKKKGKDRPGRDLKLEILAEVAEGKLPIRAHAHQANDIMTILRIADEFGVKAVVEHATEAHKIADELARRKVPAVVGPTMPSRSKVELRDKTFETPGILDRAGVKVAIMTDHPVIPIAQLAVAAALAVKHGMDEERALRAITLSAAEILGV